MISKTSSSSSLSGIDQVTIILVKNCKFPFELVCPVFEYLSVTYLESNLGASLEQLIAYSKNTTFELFEVEMRSINGGYELSRGKEIYKIYLHHLWFLCKPIFMRFMFAKFKIEIIDFLLHRDLKCLATLNRLDLLEIIYAETDAFNGFFFVVDEAAFYGHLDIIKYLIGMGASCSAEAMDNAAFSGHLDVVKWLHYNRSEGCSASAISVATQYCQNEVVEFLKSIG